MGEGACCEGVPGSHVKTCPALPSPADAPGFALRLFTQWVGPDISVFPRGLSAYNTWLHESYELGWERVLGLGQEQWTVWPLTRSLQPVPQQVLVLHMSSVVLQPRQRTAGGVSAESAPL